MTASHVYKSKVSLPDYPQNLALMLSDNAERFASRPMYQEVQNGKYVPLTWDRFLRDVTSIQNYLISRGFESGDRLAILSPNRQEMLELELAVMAMGGTTVPIFAGYPSERANALVDFCEPKFVAVADQAQYDKLVKPERFQESIIFDAVSTLEKKCTRFWEMLSSEGTSEISGKDISGDTVCLMMYTSGTMGKPKCVQLTHSNILSQQAAMRLLWSLTQEDRFLSYLPWHHSFGGIFEKFAAIVNSAVLSLEHGYGKNIDLLLENWGQVLPTVFFSVPRIYQEMATRIMQDPKIEEMIFHDNLRFVFTAAAPLPKNIADLFDDHGIPVVEGWGLTETSPCCTITDPTIAREPGVVGQPIPGVSLQLAEDGEILVRGPNVMTGYFKNEDATKKVLTKDGWFHTGDVGEVEDSGLLLISRKDRIFKLSNAEKVIPTEIENIIAKDCAYLSHAYVSGNGKNYPVILLFPNKAMFLQEPDQSQLMEGCKCPKNLDQYFNCLSNCLKHWNASIEAKYARPKKAMLINHELSMENEELTPSLKLAPNVVRKVFKAQIESLYDEDKPISEEAYVIAME